LGQRGITFLERYESEPTWHGRATIIELYHLAMTARNKGNWTISKTAEYFQVSNGLVCENLKLAYAIHLNENILKCESRKEALKKLNGHAPRTFET